MSDSRAATSRTPEQVTNALRHSPNARLRYYTFSGSYFLTMPARKRRYPVARHIAEQIIESGSVEKLPYEPGTFETVYAWKEADNGNK